MGCQRRRERSPQSSGAIVTASAGMYSRTSAPASDHGSSPAKRGSIPDASEPPVYRSSENSAASHRHLIPLDRTFERDVRAASTRSRAPHPTPAEIPAHRARGAAWSYRPRHADHRGAAADAAGIPERLDERLLPLGRPAIMPVFARHGREIGRSGRSLRATGVRFCMALPPVGWWRAD